MLLRLEEPSRLDNADPDGIVKSFSTLSARKDSPPRQRQDVSGHWSMQLAMADECDREECRFRALRDSVSQAQGCSLMLLTLLRYDPCASAIAGYRGRRSHWPNIAHQDLGAVLAQRRQRKRIPAQEHERFPCSKSLFATHSMAY